MEQRILEDLSEGEVMSEKDRLSTSGYLQTEEMQSSVAHSDEFASWTSSHFLGDDQELAEELERLYREGK